MIWFASEASDLGLVDMFRVERVHFNASANVVMVFDYVKHLISFCTDARISMSIINDPEISGNLEVI